MYVTAVTASDGTYTVSGLWPGEHKVWFHSLQHMDEWYSDKADFDSADYCVTSGQTTQNIDVQLADAVS